MAYTTINKSTNYFNSKLYTGTGAEHGVTGIGFQPDWVWIKERANSVSHRSFDVARGATKEIFIDLTDAESTDAQSLKSFDSDGFTLGTDGATNGSSDNYASWSWRAGGSASSNTDGTITSSVSANTTAGFSVVTYSGNGTAGATVGHGLGSALSMIIVKQRNNTRNWVVSGLNIGFTKYLYLDSTNASATADFFNDTNPTSSVFSLSSDSGTNNSSGNYVAYCFAEKKGYSKFGSYTGNGNANGAFIYTGFAPKFVLLKRTDSADGWWIVDDKQANPLPNPNEQMLVANTNAGNNTSVSPFIDIYSNGFKLRSNWAGVNGSGGTYIYMAFGQTIVGSNNIPANAR